MAEVGELTVGHSSPGICYMELQEKRGVYTRYYIRFSRKSQAEAIRQRASADIPG
jgi:hypothetical protein